MTSLRAKEDKVWDVLVHPHPHDAAERGLNNNNPRWKIPAKARNEHYSAMIENHHFLKGGFKEFYAQPAAAAAGGSSGSAPLPPVEHRGDRKHFAPQRCVEQQWHPSFKRATIDIFPARPTGKRALTPPNEHNRTEVDDIPRGRRRVEGIQAAESQLADLPMFGGVKAVRDPRTGQRLMDKRCPTNADEQAFHRGVKKPSQQQSPDGGRRYEPGRVANEVEFRREYAARMAATLVNRDATNRANRETAVANETLSKHRLSRQMVTQDRAKAYDIACVRGLPSFVPDDD